MAMTFSQQFTAANDLAFLPVVQLAAVKVALDVAAENPATAGHAQRASFAVQVLRAPQAFATIIAEGVVADTTTDKLAADIVIYNRISAIWNAYAGA